MRWSPAAWGVDFSDGTVKVVLIRRRGGKLLVEKAAKIPASGPGESIARPRNGLSNAEREALLTWLRDHPPGFDDRLIVGFPSLGAPQNIVSLPPFVGEKLHEAARFEADKLIAKVADSGFQAYYRILRGRTEADVPALVLGVSGEKLGGIRRDLNKLGLDPDAMQFDALGAAHYLELDQSVPPPYLAIQVNRLRTDLIFGLERGARVRALPFGAGRLLREKLQLQERCGEFAEKVAREVEWAKKDFFGSIEAWREGSTYLIGEGATLPELGQAITNALDGPAPQVPTGMHRIRIGAKVPESLRSELHLWGTSIGLALSGLRSAPLDLSLIPPNRARSARRFSLKAALLALVAGSLLIGATLKARSEAEELDKVVLGELVESTDHKVRRLDSLQAQYLAVERPVRQLSNLGSGRQNAVLGMNEALSVFPIASTPGVGVTYLNEIRVDMDSVGQYFLEADVTVTYGEFKLFAAHFQQVFRGMEPIQTPSIRLLNAPRADDQPAKCLLRAALRIEP